MTEATITIQNNATDMVTATISGQLDESNVDEKIKTIYEVVENNPKNLKLILDLEDLDYMNSKSIGYLTDIYGKVTEGGGKMAIAKAKSNIVDILQVVGLTQLIESYETIEEAQAAIQGAGIGTETTPAPTSVGEAAATPVAPAPDSTAMPMSPEPEVATPLEQATPAQVAQPPEAPATTGQSAPAEATATEIQSVTPVITPEPTANPTPETAQPPTTPQQVETPIVSEEPTTAPESAPAPVVTPAAPTPTTETPAPTQTGESFKLDQ